MTEIAHVQTTDDLKQVKVLFQEYADSLGFDLCFQDFEEELRSLPGNYSPPHGALLVVKHDGEITGCVAFRPLSSGVCEMKRLYVRAKHRGKGIGRALASTIIAEAAKCGYRAMRLDTLPSCLVPACFPNKIPRQIPDKIDGMIWKIDSH